MFIYYRIRKIQLAAIRKLLDSGGHVGYFYADLDVIHELNRLGVEPLESVSVARRNELLDIIDFGRLTEVVFERIKRASSLYSWIDGLINSIQFDIFLQRRVFLDLCELFQLFLAFQTAKTAHPSKLIPVGWSQSASWEEALPILRDPQFLSAVGLDVIDGYEKFVEALGLGLEECRKGAVISCVYSFVRSFIFVLKRLNFGVSIRRESTVMIRSYKTDMGVVVGDGVSKRNLDFLLVGQNAIPKHRALFWLEPEVSEERKKDLTELDYESISLETLRFGISSFLLTLLWRLLNFAFRSSFSLFKGESAWWREHGLTTLKTWLVWKEIHRQANPKIFFYYNDFSDEGILRTIILRELGCRSIFYQHSSNFPMNKEGYWETDWGERHMAFDILALWGEAHLPIYAKTKEQIRETFYCGCVWSGLIPQWSGDVKLPDAIRASHIETATTSELPSYIARVAVFDSSISPMYGYKGLVDFYAGILRLASELPEVLFICKPKNPLTAIVEDNSEEQRQVFVDLRNRPNVQVLDSTFDSSMILAIADLSISIPFTSTFTEAIGAGKRALYYDPLQSMANAFWYGIPGCVCDSDGQLLSRVRHLLWESDQSEHHAYLGEYFSEIDGFCDGGGIVRLRAFVTKLLDNV